MINSPCLMYISLITSKEEGRKEGRKSGETMHTAHMLNKSLSCTPGKLFRQVKLSAAIDKLGQLRKTMYSVF